jgi:hypothetical protein
MAERAYSACDYLIGRAAEACRTADAQLVIVTIPTLAELTSEGRAKLAGSSGAPERFDIELPERRVAESCRKHGLPLIAGSRHFSPRDYKAREGIHWNDRGHRRMARLLEQLDDAFTAGRLGEHIPQRLADRVSHIAISSVSSAPAAVSAAID